MESVLISILLVQIQREAEWRQRDYFFLIIQVGTTVPINGDTRNEETKLKFWSWLIGMRNGYYRLEM